MKKVTSIILCLGVLFMAHFVMARGTTALTTVVRSLVGSEATSVFFTIL